MIASSAAVSVQAKNYFEHKPKIALFVSETSYYNFIVTIHGI